MDLSELRFLVSARVGKGFGFDFVFITVFWF